MEFDDLIGLSRDELEQKLQDNYETLSEISARQRDLNTERDVVESNRDMILIELGRIGIQPWDVT